MSSGKATIYIYIYNQNKTKTFNKNKTWSRCIFLPSKDTYAFLATQVKVLDCMLVIPGYDLAPHGKYVLYMSLI